MYATIRSYDRLFSQAARLREQPAPEARPVMDGEWVLLHDDGRRVEFRLTGAVATTKHYYGKRFIKQREMSREVARETYRKLLAAGFCRW